MNSSLAVVPRSQGSQRPDISWIKKNVSVLEVAKALGMRIRRGRAHCWRPENHTHGDADPSLHFYERRNRVRCFVCDMRGGHSCVDLVMGVLDIQVGAAVRWIAERFSVPNVKVGRPAGNALASPAPYRVGAHGSEWEVIVRSGIWGAMTAAERSILVVLDYFKDPETGLTLLSYRAIMRYSGVGKTGNVAGAIRELARINALQVLRGSRVGVTRECSIYRVTLTDPKFLEICNETYTSARMEIAQEREYRASQKAKRQRDARKPDGPSLQVVTQNTNARGGLRPPAPPAVIVSNSNSKTDTLKKEASTCEGLNLSSPGEVHANKALPAGKREIGISALLSEKETDPRLLAKVIRDKNALRAKGLLP